MTPVGCNRSISPVPIAINVLKGDDLLLRAVWTMSEDSCVSTCFSPLVMCFVGMETLQHLIFHIASKTCHKLVAQNHTFYILRVEYEQN